MDSHDPEAFGRDENLDESSGSIYEVSDEEHYSYEDEDVPASRAGLETGSTKSRGRSGSMARVSSKKRRASRNPDAKAEQEDQKLEDASEWAAKFQAPDPEDIKTPRRQSRSRAGKRKASKPATETRVKRLKGYYNDEYRELLNGEIRDAVSRVVPYGALEGSQIGSSIWTKVEKDVFFASLDRLGRDSVQGIAERVGTKSQFEVQEYIKLLHSTFKARKQQGRRVLTTASLPAAVEISDECTALLERAADALATHQELAEEKVEKGKWGDSWLITEDVAHAIEQRRKEVEGEEAMREVLPAANLLDFRKWLELSNRVFMNPSAPREEENWENIAEPGEAPAVRATAFEDFHSLAFSITKRLVATVLFCTQSRLRAKGSITGKHAEVNADDVQAAINILGLKANSDIFWIGAAIRCNLKVVDDEDSTLTYQEVETALQSESRDRKRSQSRSRSRSLQPRPFSRASQPTSAASDSGSPAASDSDSDSDPESASVPNSPAEDNYMHSPPPSPSSRSASQTSKHDPEAADALQDAETEAFDTYNSQAAELRLWAMLDQTPPFEFTATPGDRPVTKPVKDELAAREEWRGWVHYVGPWEAMETPVGEEQFEKNRAGMSRVAEWGEKQDGRDLAGVVDEGGDGSLDLESRDRGRQHEEQDSFASFREETQDAEDRFEVESPRAERSLWRPASHRSASSEGAPSTEAQSVGHDSDLVSEGV